MCLHGARRAVKLPGDPPSGRYTAEDMRPVCSGHTHLKAVMQRFFDTELEDLKKQLLLMSALVESQLQDALQSLIMRNSDLAIRIVEHDVSIDKLDVEIDEACLRLLALHQPAAGDLRFITTTMKISTELERMSDLAVNIAERVIELNREP